MTHPFLALTDDDRDEMLETIGVASIDELFRDIPAGVRLTDPEEASTLLDVAGYRGTLG